MRTIEEQASVSETGWIPAGQSRARKKSHHPSTAPNTYCGSNERRSVQAPPDVPHQLIPFLDHVADLLAASLKHELSRESPLHFH